MVTTSRTLLDRLRQGQDRQAWRLWVSVYEPWLRSYLESRLQPADTDDVLQNVLVAVRQGLPAFQHNGRPGAFRKWLRTILVSQTSLFWRRLDHRTVPFPSWVDQLADDRSDLTRQWDEDHNREVVRRMLGVIQADFQPHVWEAFRLAVLEDLPLKEVARRCGLRVGTVRVYKFRVLARLREELGDTIAS
jgi:RNA polymerase sigma-70 factor (ECF subfamily)